ncbi:MAG: nucleotidyl transferase AbiEii/AbiGii toxin family protein [Firmicutes bacterium]|nr:nucleotidyl transferase AbiEii/AbiGii toxin family protein [Bacillota bacterium]
MNTSKQLKDLINNKAKKSNLNPQILLTRFFMERFLERISLSKYKKNFVLKGGILISAIVGVDARMTRDMDITLKSLPLNEASIKNILEEIIATPIDDATQFTLVEILPIREEFDYTGFKAKIEVVFDKTRNMIQVDITAGDTITPKEIVYKYKLLLENRNIGVTAYPIETILAEKLECTLARSVANTRMKDFYDCYTLSKMYSDSVNFETLLAALKNTAKTRKTEYIFDNVAKNLELIETDDSIKHSWLNYAKQFAYAKDITFEAIISELKLLLKKVGIW